MIKSFYSGLLGGSSGSKKGSRLALKAGISIGILAFLLWWLPTEILFKALGTIPVSVWAIVILGFIAGHIISAMKWKLLLSAVNVRITATEAVRAHGAGLFANLCLPSIVGGDFVRAGVVIKDRGQIEAIALGSLADRVNDTFALVTMAGLAGLMVPEMAEMKVARILTGMAVFLLVMVTGGMGVILWIPVDRIPGKLAKVVVRFRDALKSLVRVPHIAFSGFLLSVGIQSGFVGLNVILADSMGIKAPFILWFFAWPLAKIIALVPVSLGGIGVREAALAAIMTPFGIQSALVVAQSISWEVVLIISGLCAGLFVTMLPAYKTTK